MSDYYLRGCLIWPESPEQIRICEGGVLEIRDGRIARVHESFPPADENGKKPELPLRDMGEALVVPPFADIHLHAVQYVNRGLGLDRELLEWLSTYTYPEERRFEDLAYADKVFRALARDLKANGSLYSVIFSSLHRPATLRLMEILEEAGLEAYVGKVNMDQNGGPGLQETAESSLRETEEWLEERLTQHPESRVRPIITPRFIPSCSEALLKGLGELVERYHLPVQSHLNENPAEVAWVQSLCPERKNYLDAYDYYGLLPQDQTIMAHCIHNTPEEEQLLLDRGVRIAHCAASNGNLGSGILRCREYLRRGMKIGIGSDISGGDCLSMQDNLRNSLKASALLGRMTGGKVNPLSFKELFWLATRGGSEFFGTGKGRFEAGADADYLVVDMPNEWSFRPLSPEEKLQKFLFLGKPSDLKAHVLGGQELSV